MIRRANLGLFLGHEGNTEADYCEALLADCDMQSGDAQFLIDDPARPIQIRPILRSECPHRPLSRSDRLLVCRRAVSKIGLPLYFFVQPKPFRRENTPRNVAEALRRLRLHKPKAAALIDFEAAHQSKAN